MNAFTSTPTQPILNTIESTENEKLVPAGVLYLLGFPMKPGKLQQKNGNQKFLPSAATGVPTLALT
ncbi:unknown [Eggerthella sp. CAG:368]|nr:unknown [Eggerthella sp. CAG:368]